MKMIWIQWKSCRINENLIDAIKILWIPRKSVLLNEDPADSIQILPTQSNISLRFYKKRNNY